jgi:hypothetical protein
MASPPLDGFDLLWQDRDDPFSEAVLSQISTIGLI